MLNSLYNCVWFELPWLDHDGDGLWLFAGNTEEGEVMVMVKVKVMMDWVGLECVVQPFYFGQD